MKCSRLSPSIGRRLRLPQVALALFAGPLGVGAAVAADATAPPAAPEARVWRCGNVYSHQPCAGGQVVDVDDSRTPQQVEQARAQQQKLQAALEQRERERTQAEAEARAQAQAQARAEYRRLLAEKRLAREIERQREHARPRKPVHPPRHPPARVASDIRRSVKPAQPRTVP